MGKRSGTSLSRDVVVETAIDCVATEGVESLGVNRVARALGIRPPSLYHYVRSNDDLKVAVAVEGWRRLADKLRSLVGTGMFAVELREDDAGSERVVFDKLRMVLRAHRAFAEENEGLCQVMTTTPIALHDPRLLALKREFLDLFGEALKPVSIDPETFLHIVRAIRSCVHGFLVLRASGQFPFPTEAEESFEWMVEAMALGILAKARSCSEIA